MALQRSEPSAAVNTGHPLPGNVGDNRGAYAVAMMPELQLDERFVKVKIAPGTTVKMLASSVSPLEPEKPAADDKLKDLKDAKTATDKK